MRRGLAFDSCRLQGGVERLQVRMDGAESRVRNREPNVPRECEPNRLPGPFQRTVLGILLTTCAVGWTASNVAAAIRASQGSAPPCCSSLHICYAPTNEDLEVKTADQPLAGHRAGSRCADQKMLLVARCRRCRPSYNAHSNYDFPRCLECISEQFGQGASASCDCSFPGSRWLWRPRLAVIWRRNWR